MAQTTKNMFKLNSEFIEKECVQAEKQIDKEICKIKVEFNEEKIRQVEEKIAESKQLEQEFKLKF